MTSVLKFDVTSCNCDLLHASLLRFLRFVESLVVRGLLICCLLSVLQGGEIQTRVGLLLLLCSWLSSCSLAVAHFLHNSANIPYVSF